MSAVLWLRAWAVCVRAGVPRLRVTCLLSLVTFLLHVHLLDLLAVQDLDGDLVAGQDMLRDLDLGKKWRE